MVKFLQTLFVLFFVFFQNSLAYSKPLPSSKTLISTLKKQQYVTVPIDIKREEFEGVVEAFYAFLELPENLRKTILYKIDKNHRRGDMGYIRKNRKKGDGDSKIFFHYHPVLDAEYRELMEEYPCIKDFFKKARAIWQKSHDRLKDILKSLEGDFPGVTASVFDVAPDQHVHITLRLLRYDVPRSEGKLARSHFDVGCCTLALAESGPGLRIGSKEETLSPIKHKDETAVFFFSKNIDSMLGKGSGLLPGWHDVIQMEKRLSGIPQQRWSIVVFVDALGSTGGTIKEMHTNPVH